MYLFRLSALTSGQSAVCECVSSASLSADSRQTPQTSLGPLTFKRHIKSSSRFWELRRELYNSFMLLFSVKFQDKIQRKGAPKPEVWSSSSLRKKGNWLRQLTSVATSSGVIVIYSLRVVLTVWDFFFLGRRSHNPPYSASDWLTLIFLS